MRRFRIACTECGYEWEEVSVTTTADRIGDAREALGETLVMALMWGGFLFILIGAVVAIPIGFAAATGSAAAGVVLGIFLGIAGALGVFSRGRFRQEREASETMFYGWISLPRPKQDRDDRQLARPHPNVDANDRG